MSFDELLPRIPLDEASDYFLRLKYGSSRLVPTEEQVVEMFKALPDGEKVAVLQEAGLTKEAVLGPMMDLQALGMPSAAGYVLGKQEGRAMADRGVPMDERNMMAALMIPGALGYRYGKTTGYEEAQGQKGKNKEKKASEEPSLEEYLSQEQAAMAAEKENERGYLQNRVRDMGGELEMTQQGSQQSDMQMQQMQQQLAQSNQQIQMAQQQAAMAQQQALQAQQSTLQKADESLRTQQMAAQMRMAYQQLREQLMQLATTDPAMSVGNEMKGQPPEMGPDGTAAPAPGADPTGGPPPPEQEAAPSGPPEGAMPESKVASSFGQSVLSAVKDPFAVMGAVGGASAGSLLANREVESGPERHKEMLAKLKAEPEQGFGNALQQAKAKAMLAFSEAARQHPNAAVAAGALTGASMGVGSREALRGLMTNKKY